MTLAVIERFTVGGVAMLTSATYACSGLRQCSCAAVSARARYTAGSVAVAIAILLALDRVSAVVSYGLLCLAIVIVYVADLSQEQSERKRRVASLTPRAVADVTPTVWVAVAAISPLTLAPYVVLREELVPALVVGVSAYAMSAVAWRLATAPAQLAGGDPLSERVHDRCTRYRRAGLSALLAVTAVFVFVSFVNGGLAVVTPVQRALPPLLMAVCVVLWVWVSRRDRLLSRAAYEASS